MATREIVETEGRPLLQDAAKDFKQSDEGKGATAFEARSSAWGLNAEIFHRPAFAHVEVVLQDRAQEMLAQAGSLKWMDSGMDLSTSCYGGCCPALCRSLAGNRCCINKYAGPGKVTVGFDLPGDILPFAAVRSRGWILTDDAFVCGTANTVVSGRFSGCTVCLCGGEGAFLTHIHTRAEDEKPALFYAGGYGQIQKQFVPEGKTLCVGKGLFFACTDDVKIEIGLPGGCTECLCSGEGFVMKFHGPCTVYTQNRDPHVIKKILNPTNYVKMILEILKELIKAGAEAAGR